MPGYVVGSDVEHELLAPGDERPEKHLRLLLRQVVVGRTRRTILACPFPRHPWIGMAQDDQDARSIAHEIEIPLQAFGLWVAGTRLGVVGEKPLHGLKAAQCFVGRLCLCGGLAHRAVPLDHADVPGLEEAPGGEGEVDPGAVQATHRRPLAAQDVVPITILLGEVQQLAQRDDPPLLALVGLQPEVQTRRFFCNTYPAV